jgi:hypothetical protein
MKRNTEIFLLVIKLCVAVLTLFVCGSWIVGLAVERLVRKDGQDHALLLSLSKGRVQICVEIGDIGATFSSANGLQVSEDGMSETELHTGWAAGLSVLHWGVKYYFVPYARHSLITNQVEGHYVIWNLNTVVAAMIVVLIAYPSLVKRLTK